MPVAKQLGEPTEQASVYAPDSKAGKMGVQFSDMCVGDALDLEVGGFIGGFIGMQTVDQNEGEPALEENGVGRGSDPALLEVVEQALEHGSDGADDVRRWLAEWSHTAHLCSLQDHVGEQPVELPVGLEASYKVEFAGSALSDNCSHEEASERQAARSGDCKPTALAPRARGAEALVEAPEGASKGVRWAAALEEITQQVVPEVSAASEAPTEAHQLILGAAMLAREALQRGDIAEGLRLLEAAQERRLVS
ncbi:unnamed protein product [Prorocentrum cordatum]|uniref:Uncharacterized protein n=1 Tax=Prorocentrum cordatum TaxID=2364126 RepID=A0ABN9TBM5_9DINO|nr:unnamed protein product [Polarella glacialis]